MTRDLHFLERGAERMDRPELEFAVQLYQDRPTLEFVLGEASIPESAERIALSLHPDDSGPWLVVTRTADFVTCLGRGMQPKGLHVVSVSQVAALVARQQVLRDRLAFAENRAPPEKRERFLQRLLMRGRFITREEFLTLAALQPVFYDEALDGEEELARMFITVMEQARGFLKHPPNLALQKRLCQAFFGGSVFLPLLALDGREHGWAGDDPNTLPWLHSMHGHIPQALRAAWAVGRVGKPLLAGMKHALRTATNKLQYLSALWGLLTMGLRYKTLRAEVRKLVEASASGPNWNASLTAFHGAGRDVLMPLFDYPQAYRDHHLEQGRAYVRKLCAEKGGEAAVLYPTEESVPEDLARTMALLMPGDIRQSGDLLMVVVASLPWLAEVEADALFPPEDFVRLVHQPWRPQDTTDLFKQMVSGMPEAQPVRAAPKQGRNERCACGSGKKFKVCRCGLRAPVEAAPAGRELAQRNGDSCMLLISKHLGLATEALTKI